MCAVLLVEGHDILELFRFLKLLSEKCFKELIFRQRSNIQGHVVPVILKLLEVVPLEMKIYELIPFKHCAVFVG